MSQHPHRTLWRRDFDVVPAAERRLARFALQWLDSFPAARVALSADDTLVSIWRLTLPLLDPEAVAGWLPPIVEGSPDEDADVRYESDLERQLVKRLHNHWPGDEDQALDHHQKRQVHAFFKTLPRVVLSRLAKADGRAPVSTRPASAYSISWSSASSPRRCAVSCARAAEAAGGPIWNAWPGFWGSIGVP